MGALVELAECEREVERDDIVADGLPKHLARVLAELEEARDPRLALRESLGDLCLRVAAQFHLEDGLGDLRGREVVPPEVLGEHRELRVVLVAHEERDGDGVEGRRIFLPEDAQRFVPAVAGDQDVAVPDLATVRQGVGFALDALVPDDEVLEETALADVLDELGDLAELEADVAEHAHLDSGELHAGGLVRLGHEKRLRSLLVGTIPAMGEARAWSAPHRWPRPLAAIPFPCFPP